MKHIKGTRYFERKLDASECAVCHRRADEYTGDWRIVRGHAFFFFPFAWLPGGWADLLHFGVTRTKLVCDKHDKRPVREGTFIDIDVDLWSVIV